MKKVLILIAMITLPVISFGQNASTDTVKQHESAIVEYSEIQQTETKTASTRTAKAEVANLSYKKSNELTSIKAYRKSLQIKVKEIKSC